MPSTRALPTLILAHRRAQMTAFGLVATAVIGGIVMACAALLGARRLWPYGAAAGLFLLPGLMSRMWCELEISAWNKGVRVTAALLRAYVLKVSYYTLFWPLSLTGSRLCVELRNNETSRWITRDAATPPGQQRVIGLRAIIWLLTVFRDEQQVNAPPPGTYTLY
jgi:hypothetical protein